MTSGFTGISDDATDSAPGRRGGSVTKPFLVGSYVTAVFLPPIGLILGVILLIRRRVQHAVLVVLVSIVSASGFLILVNRNDGSPNYISPHMQQQTDKYVACVEQHLNLGARGALRACNRLP
jgi:hypothetical protein